MIGLSDCPVTQNDWCVRRHRLSVVKDHDGPCPSFCVFECVHVGMSVCVVSVSVRLQACVSVLCVWLDSVCVHEPLIDVTYLRVTNVSPAPAVFDLGLMGARLPYSLIKLGIVQSRLWSWVGRESCHWDMNSRSWNPYSPSSCSKSNMFCISTCLSPV